MEAYASVGREEAWRRQEPKRRLLNTPFQQKAKSSPAYRILADSQPGPGALTSG
jgi:hypothetical protein